MWLYLYMRAMIRAGMLTRDDMTGFSEELHKQMGYAFEETRANLH